MLSLTVCEVEATMLPWHVANQLTGNWTVMIATLPAKELQLLLAVAHLDVWRGGAMPVKCSCVYDWQGRIVIAVGQW